MTVTAHDLKRSAATLIHWLELVIAVVVVGATAFAFFKSIGVVRGMDWTGLAAFYELLDRLLVLVIGLEFARMLVVHNLISILELLGFVIARKILKPDLPSVDVVFGVFAFVLLVAARYIIGHYHRNTGIKPTEVMV